MYKHNFVKVGMVVPKIKLGDAYSNALEIVKIIEKDYKKITVDVITNDDFAQLYANYVLTENNLVYSIETLNLLPSDGNYSDVGLNYKTTNSGYALIENGEVVEITGDKDIFVHYSAIELDGYKTLSENQLVEFKLIFYVKIKGIIPNS